MMKRKHQRTLELIFARPVSGNLSWRDIEALFLELGAVTARKDDAPAAGQAAIANVAGMVPFSGGGGLIQTTSG